MQRIEIHDTQSISDELEQLRPKPSALLATPSIALGDPENLSPESSLRAWKVCSYIQILTQISRRVSLTEASRVISS